jgi:NADH dehydrogenase (ubiquinone) 1 alpha subcomplex subunit 13
MRPRGPSGAVIWGTIFAMTIYGFSVIGETNAEKRFCRKEQREARMSIMPILMAEADGMLKVESDKALEYEKKIMQNVPGWVVGESVMSTGARWQKPTRGL